jgi:hypothetical protein
LASLAAMTMLLGMAVAARSSAEEPTISLVETPDDGQWTLKVENAGDRNITDVHLTIVGIRATGTTIVGGSRATVVAGGMIDMNSLAVKPAEGWTGRLAGGNRLVFETPAGEGSAPIAPGQTREFSFTIEGDMEDINELQVGYRFSFDGADPSGDEVTTPRFLKPRLHRTEWTTTGTPARESRFHIKTGKDRVNDVHLTLRSDAGRRRIFDCKYIEDHPPEGWRVDRCTATNLDLTYTGGDGIPPHSEAEFPVRVQSGREDTPPRFEYVFSENRVDERGQIVGNREIGSTRRRGQLPLTTRTPPEGGQPPEEGSFSRPGGEEPQAVSTVPAPQGSRIVLTGSVVEGDEATLAVIDPAGQRLSGVVVDIDGEDHVTGADGRVVFAVAATAAALRAALPSLPDQPAVEVPVVARPTAPLTGGPPRVERAPRYPTSGGELAIAGTGFDGDASGNTVQVGQQEFEVLAASPTGLVAAIPADALGDLGPLVVTTKGGSSRPVETTFVRFALEGGPSRLRRGQTAVRRVVLKGTSDRVRLRVTNLTPGVVAMEGGDVVTVSTSGGTSNRAEIRISGVTLGDFELLAEVVEEAATR